MSNLKKVSKSNKAHQNSFERYERIFKSTKGSTAKSFWADVKRDYHRAVLYTQKNENRLLTYLEKKNIYNKKLNLTIDCRKTNNKQLNTKQYIPKKYR